VKWGLIWGPLQGFWFLAPHFLTSHVLYPNTILDWLFVLLFLLGVFAASGVLCSVFATFPFVIYSSILRPASINPSQTHGTIVGVLLPIVYLLLGYFFVWAKLGTILPLSDVLDRQEISALLGIVLGILAYHSVIKRRVRPHFFNIDPWLVACTILGALLVPYRISDPRSTKPIDNLVNIKPPASTAAENPTPLVFIGIDGANWKSIAPLLNGRSLPTLEQLVKHGVHGTINGFWPPYLSGPAWAAMLTGFPREQTGIYEDLMVLAPPLETPFQLPLIPDIKLVPLLLTEHYLVRLGLVEIKPQSRFMLHRPPIWEMLTDVYRHAKIAVVRFWFTHPAGNKPGTIIVSDWAGKDFWRILNVDTSSERAMVYPESLSNKVLSFFNKSPSYYRTSDFVDNRNYRQSSDAIQDPIEMLESSLQIDGSTLAVSKYILEKNPNLHALMVYLGGYDIVAHAFWQYRFPEEFSADPPKKIDIDRLRPVMDRYLQFLDRQIGDLIDVFPVTPNVLIVSDHGHEANHMPLIWRSKHAPDGIFIASGPDIRPISKNIRVTYYDIVPTILHLFRLEKPKDLQGISVLERN
jgi:predicted AlkP superfamily phosphohydrolase/phosphomutase